MVHDHFWRKHFFDPFLTHLWSQNGPFSRHIGIFHGPTRVSVWLKLRASFYEAQIGLGARLVSANPPPPPPGSTALYVDLPQLRLASLDAGDNPAPP